VLDAVQVLLAHPGTQHSYHLARELECRGLLGEFWTGLAFPADSPTAALARVFRRFPGLGGLGSRIVRGIPAARLHTLPGGELRALWRLHHGGESHAVLHARNEKFQHAISELSLANSGAVIGFDTSGWILAERCRRLDRRFYLDRTIGHPAVFLHLMQKFGQKYPAWVLPLEKRPAELVAAEQGEHELAHRIVVGSSFARDTLVAEGIDPAKIGVNPYGVDWNQFMVPLAPIASAGRPLRFLYVGSVTARKGVPVLLDAWRALSPRNAELWLAGSVGPQERVLIPSLPGLCLLGQVPHAEIHKLYAQCDVFVLPSLFEGFSLVLLEALAAGLPVISTPNTGAVDVVTHTTLGQIVEAGSVEALVAAMRRYLEAPPFRAVVRSAAAMLQSTFSWEAYGDRWAALLRETA
jgi:glycosyltransferase involved in cell wall biosynthesis